MSLETFWFVVVACFSTAYGVWTGLTLPALSALHIFRARVLDSA